MPQIPEINDAPESLLAKPWFGTLLTTLSGLSFLLVCMILPLVGKAGVRTTYAAENQRAFLATLLVATFFAAAASWSKISRRHIDNSPLPMFSLILLALCLLLLVALFMGLLHI